VPKAGPRRPQRRFCRLWKEGLNAKGAKARRRKEGRWIFEQEGTETRIKMEIAKCKFESGRVSCAWHAEAEVGCCGSGAVRHRRWCVSVFAAEEWNCGVSQKGVFGNHIRHFRQLGPDQALRSPQHCQDVCATVGQETGLSSGCAPETWLPADALVCCYQPHGP